MKKIFPVVLIIIIIAVMAIATFFIFFAIRRGTFSPPRVQSGIIRIVAAENFYGNIAGQLAGDRATVTSILSDPNVDPHEYEANVQDAIAIANADIVIENGLDYDTWMDKLIVASPNPNRTVIIAGNIAPDLLPDNPHVWYGIDNAAAVARSIANALEKKDPADAAVFENNLAAFDGSLSPIRDKMNGIKAKYAGTPVALTETIYLYQTQPMGLHVLTPFGFEKAIAEGNDPSVQDVSIADSQVGNKQVKVLIYNSQAVTPITTNLEDAAKANDIPVVPVSETMPPSVTYQKWMMDELDILEQGLQK